MRDFAQQINDKVFQNYIVENDYTKDGAYIEHRTKIQSDTLKKIARKLYYQFADKMDYESFLAEFQTQMYFASQRFEKRKTQEDLNQVLNDIDNAFQFLAYTRIVIKNEILNTYVQTSETLTDKFADQEYYDAYMMNIEEATTNLIKEWYFANKEHILTKSQIQFLNHLNRGTAKDVYSLSDIAHRKKRIQQSILKAYEKNLTNKIN